MKNCLPISEKAELSEVIRVVEVLVSRKPNLDKDGRRILSAVHNLQHCDQSQADHFRQRLVTAIKEFAKRYG